MPDHREQLAEHLKFFGELGVAGFRKDAVWSARADGGADLQVADLKVADLKVSTTTDMRSADLQVGSDA